MIANPLEGSREKKKLKRMNFQSVSHSFFPSKQADQVFTLQTLMLGVSQKYHQDRTAKDRLPTTED